MRTAWILMTVAALAGCGSKKSNNNGDGDGGTGMDGEAPIPGDGTVTLPDGKVVRKPSTPSGSTDTGQGGWGYDFETGEYFQVPCKAGGSSKIYQCGDAMDNDKDGLIDAWDPDCLGPCANNEGSFNLSIPGSENNPCNLDCYYDTNEGPGNDGCQWDHRCDPKTPTATCEFVEKADRGGSIKCPEPQAAACTAAEKDEGEVNCPKITPNGCDCFGCCWFPTDDEPNRTVFIGTRDAEGKATCNYDTRDDNEACHPCTQVVGCQNKCDRCEVCLGKNEVPDDCYPDEPSENPYPGRCPEGVAACGSDIGVQCAAGSYCITGCCVTDDLQ
jgi:hypothetical protein